MQYTTRYSSPIGGILLAADDIGLTGLWFDGEKFYAKSLDPEHEEKEVPLFKEVKHWLDIYFGGKNPGFLPPLHMIGSAFQLSVWQILEQIPYGQITTYGEIARQIAASRGLKPVSYTHLNQAFIKAVVINITAHIHLPQQFSYP